MGGHTKCNHFGDYDSDDSSVWTMKGDKQIRTGRVDVGDLAPKAISSVL